MGRFSGLVLAALVAFVAAGCGGTAGYSADAEGQFVAGCSKAAANSVAANLGTGGFSTTETAAIRTYCRSALTCLEQALSPSAFAKASKALHDKSAMEPKSTTAMGVCTRTAATSTGLAAAFAHTYPAAARSQFMASCRKSAVAGIAKHRRHHLSPAQQRAVAGYCGAALECIVKAVTIDQFAAYDKALRAGKKGDSATRARIDHCSSANLPPLKAAFRTSRG